jgi:hypothetical protein
MTGTAVYSELRNAIGFRSNTVTRFQELALRVYVRDGEDRHCGDLK